MAKGSNVLLKAGVGGLLALALLSAATTAYADTKMHRVYNPNSGEHFYTASTDEKDGLVKAGWRYEGIGWTAPETGAPVYRLYSGTDHHYTLSEEERDSLVKAGWEYEGVGWRSADKETGVPLYRQYNPNVQPTAKRNNSGSHNYTTSIDENDSLVKAGWRAEGIGWYGVKPVEHQHKWVDKTEKQWVSNKVWVVDTPAWTESQQVRTGSKAVFSDGHVILNATNLAIGEYMRQKALQDIDVSYSLQDIYETKTIQHEATGHYEDQGYYKTVVTGKACASCGQAG